MAEQVHRPRPIGEVMALGLHLLVVGALQVARTRKSNSMIAVLSVEVPISLGTRLLTQCRLVA